MPVRIVTDSVADIPRDVAEELGITVVPVLVRFGEEVYRDSIDITSEEFYRRLERSRFLPSTSAPPPTAFAEVYDRLAEEADEILVITVTARLSGVHETAQQSVGLMKRKCRVEVVDSEWAVMPQGFVAIKAAQAARSGARLDDILPDVHRNIKRVDMRAALNTLEYLRKGGRIGRAASLLGSMLNVKPIITLRDGVVEPAGRVHSRARVLDLLYDFAASYSHIEEMAVEAAVCPDDRDRLLDRLARIFPRERIYQSGTTPVMGAYTGPGMLLVAVLGDH